MSKEDFISIQIDDIRVVLEALDVAVRAGAFGEDDEHYPRALYPAVSRINRALLLRFHGGV